MILIAVMIAMLLPMGAFANANSNSDIKGHWAEITITKAIQNSIVNGYPDGTFRPDSTITGAEFTKMIINSLYDGVQDDKDTWFLPYVRKAQDTLNIDRLRLDYGEPINRKQMAYLLYKAGEIKGLEEREKNEFSDTSEISVKKAVSMGLLEGYPDGTFRPLQNLTRAEALVVLERLENVNTDKSIKKENNEEVNEFKNIVKDAENESGKNPHGEEYSEIKTEYKRTGVKIFESDGDYVEFKFNSQEVEPTVFDEKTTVYKNAYPETDMIFIESENRVKEIFRIHNPIDIENLSIEFEIDTNLEYVINETQITFFKQTDEGIRKVFQTDPLFMENKQKDRTYTVSYEENDNQVKMVLDKGWFEKQTEENYPIIIDPTITQNIGFLRVRDLPKGYVIWSPRGHTSKISPGYVSSSVEIYTDSERNQLKKMWANIVTRPIEDDDNKAHIKGSTIVVGYHKHDGSGAFMMSLDNSGQMKLRDLPEDEAYVVVGGITGDAGSDIFDSITISSTGYKSVTMSNYGRVSEQEVRKELSDILVKWRDGKMTLDGGTPVTAVVEPSSNQKYYFLHIDGKSITGPDPDPDPDPKPESDDIVDVIYFEKHVPESEYKFRGIRLLNQGSGVYKMESADPIVGKELYFIVETYELPTNLADIRISD